ncbi:MAG: YggS family pyridoxal phosphate-dependent enzyme [bacterium]
MGITDRIHALEDEIASACDHAGRRRSELTLVAVSKTRTADELVVAARAGIADFGENRVQEAVAKIPMVSAAVPGLNWHLIGHLQTNKVRLAIELFGLIHSVDSIRLASELDRRASVAGKSVELLIEVNTSGEESKFGVQPSALMELVEQVIEMPGLRLTGLMTIGPGWAVSDPEASRPCFRLLHQLRDEASRRTELSLPHLSMGMSADFGVGIEEGATIIRVGTALFGPRA